jgi:hypothetical protein
VRGDERSFFWVLWTFYLELIPLFPSRSPTLPGPSEQSSRIWGVFAFAGLTTTLFVLFFTHCTGRVAIVAIMAMVVMVAMVVGDGGCGCGCGAGGVVAIVVEIVVLG